MFFTGSEILFGNGGSIRSNEWKMSKIIEVAAAFSSKTREGSLGI